MWQLDTKRKPKLSLRLSGVFLLRYEGRQSSVVLFHEPPRTTRRAGTGEPRSRRPGCVGSMHPARPNQKKKRDPALRAGSRVQGSGMGQLDTKRKPKMA